MKPRLIDFEQAEHGVPAALFVCCRLILGCWLIYFIVQLKPFLPDLMLQDGIMQSLYTPGLLNIFPGFQHPDFLDWFYYLWITLASAFALGVCRKVAVILFLPLWCMLHIRAFYVPAPADGHLGLILISTLLIPSGENRGIVNGWWYFPKIVYETLWFAFLFAMMSSGLSKLRGFYWSSGQALNYIFDYINARDNWFTDSLLSLPDLALFTLNHAVLSLEIFLPLVTFVFPKMRRWFFIIMALTLLLFRSALLVDEVAFGTLVCMCFLFNFNWIQSGATTQKNVLN